MRLLPDSNSGRQTGEWWLAVLGGERFNGYGVSVSQDKNPRDFV